MAINLSALKKSSSSDLMAKLKKGIEEAATSTKKEKDSRFWSPTIGSDGNGSATIRFLPAKTEDDFPFVKVHNHGFQENGMWFIAECPTTINQPCPVCEENMALWATKDPAKIEIVRKHKRGTRFIGNILVVKDPGNPENEGKTFLYRFNKKIYDKLVESMNADPELGETPVNPFSFFDGANFIIRTQMVGGYLNFDKCKVVPAADLFGGDEEKLIAIMEAMYDLKEFVDPKLFKPYAELKTRFEKVKGSTPQSTDENASSESAPPSEKYEKMDPAPAANQDTSGDEDLAFFQSLLNQS